MIRRILVGIGETDYTASAIRQAVELALVHDAELTAVSVLDENRLTRLGPVPIGAGSFAQDLAATRMAKAKEQSE
ncbi:MAG: universal stress protein [Planctomycetota bacterium]|nr:universal stress protein [Planctomycetota bacterium]